MKLSANEDRDEEPHKGAKAGTAAARSAKSGGFKYGLVNGIITSRSLEDSARYQHVNFLSFDASLKKYRQNLPWIRMVGPVPLGECTVRAPVSYVGENLIKYLDPSDCWSPPCLETPTRSIQVLAQNNKLYDILEHDTSANEG